MSLAITNHQIQQAKTHIKVKLQVAFPGVSVTVSRTIGKDKHAKWQQCLLVLVLILDTKLVKVKPRYTICSETSPRKKERA